jgi:hypothetical protein
MMEIALQPYLASNLGYQNKTTGETPGDICWMLDAQTGIAYDAAQYIPIAFTLDWRLRFRIGQSKLGVQRHRVGEREAVKFE